MSFLRIPVVLIVSGLALPALGKTTNVGSAELSAGPIANIECRQLSSGRLNIEIECSIADVELQYAKAFARARNAEIDASIARVKAQRARAFEEARNAEIDASIARVKAQRMRAFEEARNAEISASIARVAFQRARNAEINASIARVAFHRARNVEINASIARVAAHRQKAFGEALNAEINASIARVNARRGLLETGTISLPDDARRLNTTAHGAPNTTAGVMAAIVNFDWAELLDLKYLPWAGKSQP
jgi:hypothetical protein